VLVRTRWILAVILALVGLTFIGQGVGYIGGSGMTGSSFWAVVGAILIVVAAVLAWTAVRSRPLA
jgi:glucose dehydrogenase